ncbi:uncharacterized protein LOC119315433 [Triticum dicoccoides]|uniref:uncharacterized protein LOC119315433 n=1 Tax=Triticum dicoccoides TaxID=85692 RepID=UPI0018919DE7|nr:uncharacterized protein LOC119315433 [Triticum dicoccoides]
MAPLIDDAIIEIILRLPPDEPEHLFRAALVCKRWLRIICDPGFLRSYRAFHGAPPLLGLLHRLMLCQLGPPTPCFASTTSMPNFPYPGTDGRLVTPLDCHHGRVISYLRQDDGLYYQVWDPIMGDCHVVPTAGIDWLIQSVAVLCAVDGCDHLHCHGGPFRLLFVATHGYNYKIIASVYSSETSEWNEPVCLHNSCEAYARHMQEGLADTHRYDPKYIPYVQPRRGTLVGDAVYFTVRLGNAIVEYDLGKDRLSMIDPPPAARDVCYISLMAMDDSSLGFACIEGSSLCTWSRKVDTVEAAEWVQYRVIELEKTIPVANPDDKRFVVGFAEGAGVIFVSSGVGLFTIKLNSGQVKKVDESEVSFSVLPYMSFYTPDRGRLLSLARTQ